jgi:hypothetical protein
MILEYPIEISVLLGFAVSLTLPFHYGFCMIVLPLYTITSCMKLSRMNNKMVYLRMPDLKSIYVSQLSQMSFSALMAAILTGINVVLRYGTAITMWNLVLSVFMYLALYLSISALAVLTRGKAQFPLIYVSVIIIIALLNTGITIPGMIVSVNFWRRRNLVYAAAFYGVLAICYSVLGLAQTGRSDFYE